MRVLVCGSRDWENEVVIYERIEQLLVGHHAKDITIVHGDARGADRIAETVARQLGMNIEAHPANWAFHGRGAGKIRNIEMLDSGVDLVLAFQRNSSCGTQHTIGAGRRREIPVEVYTEADKDV